MKPGSMVALLLLAGCGSPDEQKAEPEASGRTIACAPPGESAFRMICTVDRVRDAAGMLLTVHLPDGGFHRLRVADDGSGVAAADGAEPVQVTMANSREVEVSIGGARYRLPVATPR